MKCQYFEAVEMKASLHLLEARASQHTDVHSVLSASGHIQAYGAVAVTSGQKQKVYLKLQKLSHESACNMWGVVYSDDVMGNYQVNGVGLDFIINLYLVYMDQTTVTCKYKTTCLWCYSWIRTLWNVDSSINRTHVIFEHLKLGHITNWDTSFCPKDVLIREALL